MAIAQVNKNSVLSSIQASTLSRLLIIAIVFFLVVWLVIYVASPYWYSRDLLKQLRQDNLILAEQSIPSDLLEPYRAKPEAGRHVWHGPGASYLRHVWPEIAKKQNLHQILLLQFNSAAPQTIQRHYVKFPNTFQMQAGTGKTTVWFEWQRQSWTGWQLTRLCFYNPQPTEDINTCASSSR